MTDSKEVFSLAFRDENMVGSRKIYIDSFDAAAELAAKYRHASFYVDVINSLDQVTIRWENGAPDWQPGFVKPTSMHAPTYRFERPEDDFWESENRLRLLEQALQLTFDILAGHPFDEEFEHVMAQHSSINEGIWELLCEAKDIFKFNAITNNRDEYVSEILGWVSDPEKWFAKVFVEYQALSVRLEIFPNVNAKLNFGAVLSP